MGVLFMIALPFIEVVGNIHRENMGKTVSADEVVEIGSKIFKLYKFYSQPFDIGMLVNPIDEPNDIHYGENMKEYDKFHEDLRKWEEEKDKVLFGGDYLKQVKELFQVEPEFKGTLNEFLILCKVLNEHLKVDELPNKKITLKWKQSIVDKYFNQTKT